MQNFWYLTSLRTRSFGLKTLEILQKKVQEKLNHLTGFFKEQIKDTMLRVENDIRSDRAMGA